MPHLLGRGLRRRLVRFFQRGSQSRLLLAGATGLGVTTLGFSWAAGVAPTTPIVPIAVVLPPVGSSSTSTPLPPPPPVTVPGTTSTTQPGGQHPPPPPPPPPPQHQPAPTQSGPGPASGNAAPAGRANPGAAPGSFPAALGSGEAAPPQAGPAVPALRGPVPVGKGMWIWAPPTQPGPSDTFDALKWRHIGPVGNRVAAVAGVPGDPNVYYAGAASGGLWKTTADPRTRRSSSGGG